MIIFLSQTLPQYWLDIFLIWYRMQDPPWHPYEKKKKTFVFVNVKGHLQLKSKFYTMHLHKGNLCTSRKSSKLNLNLYLKKSTKFMVIFLCFSCILKDPYTLSHQTQLLYICFWNWIDKVQQKVIKYRTVCYC